MPSALELSALLSQTLVAYTIEFDNEFEHLMPHRTTSRGGTDRAVASPWLVSMVMWCNCMRFLRPEGLTVGELEGLARTSTNLAGMQRWGYLVVERPRTDEGVRIAASELVIRPTATGRQAQFIWRPLPELIEDRWRRRFGAETVDRLRSCLTTVAANIGELPDCLPILRHGWVTTIADRNGQPPRSSSELGLSALMSRGLLAFALPFERRGGLSLAISANLVRVLGSDFIRVRDVHRLAGVAAEATRNALGYLDKRGCLEFKTDVSAGRGHLVRLSEKGLKARSTYLRLVAGIELRWRERFGSEVVDELRQTLERLVIPVGSAHPPLFAGLEPYTDGWRAAVARIERLPHYPVVLHRGGFPDGS